MRCLPSGRCRSNAGAVYVEFLIAFLPFLTFFLCLWQFSILSVTKLMVDHAAVSAARAAAVIMAEPSYVVDPTSMVDPWAGGDTMNTLTTQRGTYVTTAAELALAPLIADGTITSVAVTYPQINADGSFTPMALGGPPTTMMAVEVVTTMQCQIALANQILCRNDKTKNVSAQGTFPYQGVQYQFQPDSPTP
jgi:Flp pilus assembly protein TadG